MVRVSTIMFSPDISDILLLSLIFKKMNGIHFFFLKILIPAIFIYINRPKIICKNINHTVICFNFIIRIVIKWIPIKLLYEVRGSIT